MLKGQRAQHLVIKLKLIYSHRTLATSRSTDESNKSARLDIDVESTQDTNSRAGGVPEVDIFQADMAFSASNLLALVRLGVDFGNRVEEVDDVFCGAFGGRNVGHEVEDVASLSSSEDGGLEQ